MIALNCYLLNLRTPFGESKFKEARLMTEGDYRTLETKRKEKPFVDWFKTTHKLDWDLLKYYVRELYKIKRNSKRRDEIHNHLEELQLTYSISKEAFFAGMEEKSTSGGTK
jgi:hypothetical protein